MTYSSEQMRDATRPLGGSRSLVSSGSPGPYATHNVRTSNGFILRIYPILLIFSTVSAAIFCFLYMTKPVFDPQARSGALDVVGGNPVPQVEVGKEAKEARKGETGGVKADAMEAQNSVPMQATGARFEETNLRVQHILNAETSNGQLDRIDIEVPVLYESRQLRWTPDQIGKSRELFSKLLIYQEKAQALRLEGAELLGQWNQLVDQSLPVAELRADSPSSTVNQIISAGVSSVDVGSVKNSDKNQTEQKQ